MEFEDNEKADNGFDYPSDSNNDECANQTSFDCEIRIINPPTSALYEVLSAVYLPQSTFALSERNMHASFSKYMISFNNPPTQLRAVRPADLLC
ncbi:hypothetical protein ABIB38_001820 [Massilia sp. UYP11]|uniref:hypothetical protein n=1 Tax=Massilia sp. UYP11 TaxID=1756385 RepID=UPI003D1E7170